MPTPQIPIDNKPEKMLSDTVKKYASDRMSSDLTQWFNDQLNITNDLTNHTQCEVHNDWHIRRTFSRENLLARYVPHITISQESEFFDDLYLQKQLAFLRAMNAKHLFNVHDNDLRVLSLGDWIQLRPVLYARQTKNTDKSKISDVYLISPAECEKILDVLTLGCTMSEASLMVKVQPSIIHRIHNYFNKLHRLCYLLDIDDFREISLYDFCNADKIFEESKDVDIEYLPKHRRLENASARILMKFDPVHAEFLYLFGRDIYSAQLRDKAQMLHVIEKSATGNVYSSQTKKEVEKLALRDDEGNLQLDERGRTKLQESKRKELTITNKLAPQWASAAWKLERTHGATQTKDNVKNGLSEQLWKLRKEILLDKELTATEKATALSAEGIPIPEIIMKQVQAELGATSDGFTDAPLPLESVFK